MIDSEQNLTQRTKDKSPKNLLSKNPEEHFKEKKTTKSYNDLEVRTTVVLKREQAEKFKALAHW